MNDAAILLQKGYADFKRICDEVTRTGWPTEAQIREMSLAIAEIKYWSDRILQIAHRSAAMETTRSGGLQ